MKHIASLRSSLSMGLALALLGAGCLLGGEDDGLNSNPKCNEMCQARQAKGCGGDLTSCKSFCWASYETAKIQGKCRAVYEAQEDCFNSKAVLDLGCSPTHAQKTAVCQAQVDAVAACFKERDGK